MKTIDVKICACTSCVMNGAMDLAESVEGLRKVRNELQIDADIRVEMSKSIRQLPASTARSVTKPIAKR